MSNNNCVFIQLTYTFNVCDSVLYSIITGFSSRQYPDPAVFSDMLPYKSLCVFHPVLRTQDENLPEFAAHTEFLCSVENNRLSSYIYVLFRLFASHAASYSAGQYACINHQFTSRVSNCCSLSSFSLLSFRISNM